MTPFIFAKFKNYVYFPDFANRFLVSSSLDIPSLKKFKLNFQYIFSTQNNLSLTPLRAFINIEAIIQKDAPRALGYCFTVF